MENRPKFESSAEAKPDELSDGWTGNPGKSKNRDAKPESKLPNVKPAVPSLAPDLAELEKQVNSGWDTPGG